MTTTTDIGFGKPGPEIFMHALDALGVPADAAVYVGDSLTWDVRGVRGAATLAWSRFGSTATAANGPATIRCPMRRSCLLPSCPNWSPACRISVGKGARSSARPRQRFIGPSDLCVGLPELDQFQQRRVQAGRLLRMLVQNVVALIRIDS